MNIKFRELQALGRVALPKEMRNELGMKEGDNLKITCENGKIVVEKASA